jgi:outer membrane protein assembly factor BamB
VAWATPAEFIVAALDHEGHPQWETNLGTYTSQHGFGASPIVYQDLLVIGNDQDGESSLIALQRDTGKVRWRVPRRTDVTAYSTPCVYRTASEQEELVFASKAHGLTGINPATGATNWELDLFDQRTVGSPIVAGSLIISSCGSGGGARNMLIAVKPGPKPELVYKIERSAPYVPTSVIKDDLAFLWGDNGVVTCIEAANGKKVWQKRIGGNFSSSPVRAASKLYCVSADGEVVVLAASRRYELLARNPLGELSRSTPAIAAGRLYLRTQSHLFSIGRSTL